VIKLTESIFDSLYDTNTISGKRNATLQGIFEGVMYIDKYFTHRIVTINKAFNSEDIFSFNVCDGYYGEEMDSVDIDASLADKIEREVLSIFVMSTTKEKMDYCLTLEYGGLLTKDVMESTSYEIIEITIDEIDHRNLNKKHIDTITYGPDHYHDYPDELPRGLVKKTPSGYHIIDGYHRIFGVTDRKKLFKVFTLK